MFTIADWALLEDEIFMTPRGITVATATQAMKLSYLAIPVWGAAMTCIKLSVALTLLRIPVNRAWVVFLWAITGVQVAYFVANTICIFLYCRPLAGVWDFSISNAVCLSPEVSRIASNLGSSINIFTDFSLSLAPMVMLWNLHRPLRERLLVCALMAMGLLAGVACIVKAVAVREWGDVTVDTWALAVTIATWTIVEQSFALLAACSPSLKGPLQRLLGRCGVLLTHHTANMSFVRARADGGGPLGLGPRIEKARGDGDVLAPHPVYVRSDSDSDGADADVDGDVKPSSPSSTSGSHSDCHKQHVAEPAIPNSVTFSERSDNSMV